MNEKLAVLIPVYNGGDSLVRSVESCTRAGLARDSYELIIVDNCSTDGAVALLRDRDFNGVPVHVYSNPTNIGRVPNWNRAVDIALERGFQYVTFLFAGDCWLEGSTLPDLFNVLRESHASVAFAPFVVAAKDGQVKSVSQRFHVASKAAVISPRTFLAALLNSGLFPLGPLQANIYRIDAQHRPLFDDAQPTRTDVEATLAFIESSMAPVAIGSLPFLEWREHSGRFHMSMGPARTIEDYMETFQSACLRTSLPVNYGRAKARVVLNSLRLMMADAPLRQWPRLLSLVARCAVRTPHRIKLFHFVETLWERFALGRRLLQFG